MCGRKGEVRIGLLGLLFLVFVVLKLTGYIAWSWWWVTAPLWGSLALFLAFIVIVGLFGLIAELFIVILGWLKPKKKTIHHLY